METEKKADEAASTTTSEVLTELPSYLNDGVVDIENGSVRQGDSDEGEEASGEPKTDKNDEKLPRLRRFWKTFVAFYVMNEFLILVIAVILLAKAYPPLGVVYVAPQITATWIAVIFIFLISGLSLRTEEFSSAFKQLSFNAFMQIFNFGVDSSLVFGVSRLLVLGNIVGQDLADGMTIAACLPLSINMAIVLTRSSGGDEAAAVFNSAFGNMIGVFLSPCLILGYLG